ncbi:hypothetical protein ACFSTH_04805 [Paenibacillus yanchengensis]|uniref:Uncharacterized protein n=1 Tax=Paenibacillus yanchengensis TaxID=2035833 RepID=A0ABW4YJY0_9BACL
MMKYVDLFIMAIFAVIIIIWLYRFLYRWLHTPVAMNAITLGKGQPVDQEDPVVKLLTKSGYTVHSSKHIVRIPIEINDKPLSHTARLHIDYIVEKDHATYIVKLVKAGSTIEFTANSLRDSFLIYSLVLPHCVGVIVVDGNDDSLHKVTFLFD